MVDTTHTNVNTKHVAVATKRNGPRIAAFIGGVGILLMFVQPVFGLIVIMASGIAFKGMITQIVIDKGAEFEASCQQHRFTYKLNYSDPDRDLFLGLSEEETTLLVQFRVTDYVIKERLIKLREILDVELVVNDRSVYKAGPIASLSAAAIGGIAFGGAGAIVGSLTSSRVGHGKIGNVALKLRANDIDEPFIEIPFITKSVKVSSVEAQARLDLAEKWTNLIQVIRFRLAQPPAAPTALS